MTIFFKWLNKLHNIIYIQAKENQHFRKIESLNQAAKDLRTGNLLAFEEFTSYDDSDYDSSDCEELPPKPNKTKASFIWNAGTY